jgi:sugar lactone lactonase YvrE
MRIGYASHSREVGSMNKCWMLVLGGLAMLAGCGSETAGTNGGSGGSGGTGGTGGTARTCATDIEVGNVQDFGEATRTEGITFDADGNLYVSAQSNDADDLLLDVSLAGTFETVAQSESILGLESHANGIIAAGIRTGELLLIDPATGDVDVIAENLGEPNFVVTTPWDTILVSADTSGEDTIYEVTWEGDVSTWVDGVPTPNGMVFSLDHSTLYVATTFEETGLWRVPVSANGEAGMPTKWVAFESSSAPDGVAIDSEGNVYVALNTAGQIAKVDPDGNYSILATGLPLVASLAFGQGEFDPCSIYATSLRPDTQLWRIGTGILGTEK